MLRQKNVCLLILFGIVGFALATEDVAGIGVEGIEGSTPDPRLLPGFRTRITQNGMDYGARVAMDILMQEMDGLAIPDIEASAAGSKLKISNMRIVDFPRPLSSIATEASGGLMWVSRQVALRLEADFELKVKVAFWTMTKRGSITANGRDLMFTLSFDVGRDFMGRPMPYNVDCNAYGNSIDINFQGGLSSIFNFAFSAFRSRIKSAIKAQLCAKAEEEIHNRLIPELETLPVAVTVDQDYEIDYRLVRFPTFEPEYIDTYHKGAVYLKENHTEPHFLPPTIPPHPEQTERMVYLYVTDYLMNTGFDAAFDNGRLAYNITKEMIPDEGKAFLSTTCPTSLCIGAVYPQLEEMFPNTEAEIDIFATQAPVGRVTGNQVHVTGSGEANFYIRPDGVRVNLFSITMTISASVTIGVQGNKVIFNITDVEPEAEVKATHIGDIGTGFLFETVLRIATRQFLLPKLSEMGMNGIELPTVEDVSFVNTEVIDHDTENVFIVATDLQFAPRTPEV